MLDRRKGARLPLQARAVFQLFDGTTHEANVIDLGQGGIRLQTSQAIRAGSWLEMQIIASSGKHQPIMCHGRVRWHNYNRDAHVIGVQLEGSTGQIRQWLASLRTISAAV